MSNTYRALTPQAEAVFAPGVFEADFSPMEEKDRIDGGLIEIVPRAYRVLTDNFSGGPQGAEYKGALRIEVEQALIQGGHIERVGDDPVLKPAADGSESTFKELAADGGKSAKK